MDARLPAKLYTRLFGVIGRRAEFDALRVEFDPRRIDCLEYMRLMMAGRFDSSINPPFEFEKLAESAAELDVADYTAMMIAAAEAFDENVISHIDWNNIDDNRLYELLVTAIKCNSVQIYHLLGLWAAIEPCCDNLLADKNIVELCKLAVQSCAVALMYMRPQWFATNDYDEIVQLAAKSDGGVLELVSPKHCSPGVYKAAMETCIADCPAAINDAAISKEEYGEIAKRLVREQASNIAYIRYEKCPAGVYAELLGELGVKHE